MVYYNEFNAQKAAWLRQLQADGLIADGMVDESDVRDVIPSNLTGYRRVHLFAGIGGWEYALRLAKWPEHEPIWTASFPCQPFSAAGRRRGVVDERHLWPYGSWLIEQCRPSLIVGEQVASSDGMQWFDVVSNDLESKGYTVATIVLPAACVGAPQIRHRQFWVAYLRGIRHQCEQDVKPKGILASSSCEAKPVNVAGSCCSGDSGGVACPDDAGQYSDGSAIRLKVGNDTCGCGEDGGLGDGSRSGQHRITRGRPGSESENAVTQFWERCEWVTCYNPIKDEWCARPVEPGVMPLAYGVPNRVVKIAGYGDAIVPQVAAAFLEAVKGELGLT